MTNNDDNYEDPGVDINDEIPRMSEEVIEELRARGIEMPDWHLKIPTPGDDQIERLSIEEIDRRKKLYYNEWPYLDHDPIEDNDPDEERGVCMNCGADMDYSPMHPWCVECDRETEDKWWVKRNDVWTQVEAGELPEEGETIYILRHDEDPEVVL